jgi:hypothetical protein
MIPGGRLGFSPLLSLSTATPTLGPTDAPAGRNRAHARIDRLSSDAKSFPTITVQSILPSPFLPFPANLKHENLYT